MNKCLKNTILTVAFAAAIIALMACSWYFSPFGLPLMICVSILVAYLYISCGALNAVAAAAICAVATVIFSKDAASLVVLALGIVPGLITGEMQRKRLGYYETLAGASLGFAACLAAILYTAGRLIAGGVGEMFDSAAELMKNVASGYASSIEEMPIENINYIIEEIVKMIKRAIPSYIIIFSLIAGYIHIAVVEFFIRKTSDIKLKYVRLDSHIAPKHLSYAYFVAVLLSLFMSGDGTFGVVLENIISVFDFLLAFCGFSFIESKLKKKLRLAPIRAFIYVAVLAVTSGIAMQILSIVGMLDSFSDYRRIRGIGE